MKIKNIELYSILKQIYIKYIYYIVKREICYML